VVVSTNSGCIGKTANIVSWLVDARVKDISIYDRSGALSKLSLSFAVSLKTRLDERLIFGNCIENIGEIVVFTNGCRVPAARISLHDGGDSYTVRILDPSDSDMDIVRVVKDLSNDDSVEPACVTEEVLNEKFSCSNGTTNPVDLILAYTGAPNLNGLPPWLLRNAEILLMDQVVENSTYAFFVWALFTYSKTEQRWGA